MQPSRKNAVFLAIFGTFKSYIDRTANGRISLIVYVSTYFYYIVLCNNLHTRIFTMEYVGRGKIGGSGNLASAFGTGEFPAPQRFGVKLLKPAGIFLAVCNPGNLNFELINGLFSLIADGLVLLHKSWLCHVSNIIVFYQ